MKGSGVRFGKGSFIVALLAASGLSALRQAGAIAFHVEVPMLVILSGVLLLIASRPWVPAPTWFVPEKPPR